MRRFAFSISSSSSGGSGGCGSCEVNLSRSRRVSIRRSGVIAIRPLHDQCLAACSHPDLARTVADAGIVQLGVMQRSGLATWTVFQSAPRIHSARHPTRRSPSGTLQNSNALDTPPTSPSCLQPTKLMPSRPTAVQWRREGLWRPGQTYVLPPLLARGPSRQGREFIRVC